MPEFEVVLYKFGTSLYHVPNDDATLRPNVEEKTRFTLQTFQNKKSRSNRLYYVWAKNQSHIPIGNVLFTSQTDTKNYCRDNNLKLGTNHFMTGVVADDAYNGHR